MNTNRTDIYARDMAALNGEVVTEGHARVCRERGHATHTVDGVEQIHCPRCGESRNRPAGGGTCDNPDVEHPGFPCDHPAPAPGTEVPPYVPATPAPVGPFALRDTVEITLNNGDTARGIVTSRDQSSTGDVIGYRIWLPGHNRYAYEHASRVRALPTRRPMRLSYES